MPADTFDQIYSVELQVEAAVKYLFGLAEITCLTSTDAASEHQNVRPRVEAVYTHSDANQSNHTAGPYYRSRLFGGQLTITVVTNAVPEGDGGIALHSTTRANVRNIMAKMRHDLTSTYPERLPYHTISNVMEQGTSPTINTDDGVLTSQLTFDFQVNVKPDAWPAET